MAKTIKIGGRLESVETGNIVAGAYQIIDDEKNKKQSVINGEVDAELVRLDETKQGNLTFDNSPTVDSNNPVKSGGVYAADKLLSDAIEAILLLIPSAASALNKLVDIQTMNSSIATATATFRGTYNVVSDLELAYNATHEQIAAKLDDVITTADNNDYAFVQVPVSATSQDIAKTERYKFNGEAWAYEYDLNNSGFTQAQWNAINSTITAALVSKLSALPTATDLQTALNGKQDNLTFDLSPTSGSQNPVTSGGIYARNAEIVALITALDTAKQDKLTFDSTPTQNSSNPVTSNGVYVAVSALQAAIVALDAAKQNVLTFDSTPTLGSNNPVTSSGIKTQLNRIDGDIVTLNNLYQALTQSALVVVAPTDTWPVSNPNTTTIYRVVDRVNTPPQYYSDYMWNGTSMVQMAQYNNAIDNVPTVDSPNLVKSGGVAADVNRCLVPLGYEPKMILSKWYSDTTGNLEDSTLHDCTDLIEVKEGFPFIYSNLRSRSVACFDANKQFLGIGSTQLTLLPNTRYVGIVYLKSNNYDYNTLEIRLLNGALTFKDIAGGLSDHILLNAAVNSNQNGRLEYFDALDCTPIIMVGDSTTYLYMNAKYFDVSCYASDGSHLGSIKSVSAVSLKIGFSLLPNTVFVSVCFLKSDNIDYRKLRIYSNEDEYKKALINNEGLRPLIYLGKAYNPASGNLENFDSLDCTNLMKVEGGITNYGNAIKMNQDISAVFQICCFDGSYNLLGRTVGKSFKLLENTVYFSVSFWKNKNIDYTKLLIGIDVINDIVIPTQRRGLKYYLFGDSITYYDDIAWAYDPDYHMVAYPSYIRNVLKAEVSNNGVAGDPSNSITTRLLSTDLSDAYAVTYMAGANDIYQNIPVGTLGTLDRSTYVGNLEVGLRYVLENYPEVKFYFISPCYYKKKNITPYAEAMQQVAEAYGVPVIRWDLIGGINSINADYFMFDGIHPNNKGHKLFADSLIPFLQNH